MVSGGSRNEAQGNLVRDLVVRYIQPGGWRFCDGYGRCPGGQRTPCRVYILLDKDGQLPGGRMTPCRCGGGGRGRGRVMCVEIRCGGGSGDRGQGEDIEALKV